MRFYFWIGFLIISSTVSAHSDSEKLGFEKAKEKYFESFKKGCTNLVNPTEEALAE